MNQKKFDLEKTLAELPEDVMYRTVLKMFETSQGYCHGNREESNRKKAEEAIKGLSTDTIEKVFEHYSGTDIESRAIGLMVEKNDGAPRALIERAAEIHVNNGDFSGAGNLYERINHLKAGECYMKAERWIDAAKQFEYNDFKQSSICYEKGGDLKNAAVQAQHYDVPRAVRLALESGEIELAAQIEAREGDYETALDLCGNDMELKRRIANYVGNHSDVVFYFEEAGKIEDAAEHAKQTAMHSSSEPDKKHFEAHAKRLYGVLAKEYIENNDLERAGWAACGAGDPFLQADIALKQGDKSLAAGYLMRHDRDRATKLYQEYIDDRLNKGDFKRAAEAAESLGDTERSREYLCLAYLSGQEIHTFEERELVNKALGTHKRVIGE